MERSDRIAPDHCAKWTHRIGDEEWSFCSPSPVPMLSLAAAAMDIPTVGAPSGKLLPSVELFAAALGICAVSYQFDAPPPTSPAEVRAYAHAVMGELWDAGIRPSAYMAAGAVCSQRISGEFVTINEADDRRDFSAEPGAPT